MSHKTLTLTPILYQYILGHSVHETSVLQALRQKTALLPGAQMQISPEQGQFMALLLQLMQAKKVLEIGTFTGYSAIVMAQVLPDDGKLITCDVSRESTAIAEQFWAQAGLAHKISLRLQPALETLDQLLAQGQGETFDFIFIDADKTNYLSYYQRAYQLVRPGGLIAIDNVLWSGDVADPNIQDKQTNAIRDLNEYIFRDERVVISLVPVSDGLTLALRICS